MHFRTDGRGQQVVAWEISPGAWKMAWIQDRNGTDKDWAGTGLYLNVVRTEGPNSGPGGNATDFPIGKHMQGVPQKQILATFVLTVSTMCGLDVSLAASGN
ncbi:hypothetical protein [Methylorubrum extorquens]|uniref:hypothetical protein n=1 Tax=Methylorubrum extorquens TaxID=408 RepID=UPI002237ACD0|nr:hypothetical protein [Methylorubrum extorquens]UYW34474.1 hypothetical protein OKB92_10450 [Methylorubrum extorquens]